MCRRIAAPSVLLTIGLFLTACPSLCPPWCLPPEGNQVNVRLNGFCRTPAVPFLDTEDGVLLDVAKFMEAIGGRFVPIALNKGIVTQYGKRIGFSYNGFEFGMVQAKLCPMEPACREVDGVLYAPLGYLETMMAGRFSLDLERKCVRINAPRPAAPGSVIPETAGIVRRLKEMGYTVQQGGICLTNAIEVVRGGYAVNANGNNAGFPYFCIQAPLPPDADHAVFPPQFIFSLREDEALVAVGRTPPECDYYSYRSYMMCLREEGEVNPFIRTKIYTQLGDPLNAYNITDGRPDRNRFGSFFTIVSTADAQMYEAVSQAMQSEGLDQSDLLLDVLDHNLLRLGNDDFADGINFLHRVSCFHNGHEESAYLTQPTIEILRVTPAAPRQANLLEPFEPRTRGSGVTEAFLQPSVDALRQALLDAYSADYNVVEPETEPWLNLSGRAAIDSRTDVLGETRDTLYLRTGSFTFDADTVVIVYGVNHVTVPKSVYNTVSCYGTQYFNGFGGITNHHYADTALPYLPGDPYANKLYVWKFARNQIDDETFAVPEDVNNDLMGIDNGDEAFMAFRAYIDPGCGIGPAPEEIIFDRALVLTPK